MRPLALLPLLALPACANTIHGEVDGEDVGAVRDAVFQLEVLEIPFVGSVTGVALAITGATDACEGYDELGSVDDDCTDRCEELAVIAEDHLPSDDLWTLWVWLATDDEVVGHYEHADENSFDGFGASIQHDEVSALRDYEACIALCEVGEDVPSTSTDSTGGTIEVTAYESADSLEGEFTIEFGADTLEGRFAAGWCELFDWL